MPLLYTTLLDEVPYAFTLLRHNPLSTIYVYLTPRHTRYDTRPFTVRRIITHHITPHHIKPQHRDYTALLTQLHTPFDCMSYHCLHHTTQFTPRPAHITPHLLCKSYHCLTPHSLYHAPYTLRHTLCVSHITALHHTTQFTPRPVHITPHLVCKSYHCLTPHHTVYTLSLIHISEPTRRS